MSISRRSFLKYTGLTLAALPVAQALFSAKARAADLPPASDKEGMGKTLHYCPNAKKPSANCADRKKPENKDHFCKGCQLYTKLSGEGEKEIGKCMIMPTNTVNSGGWCPSWVKRPG